MHTIMSSVSTKFRHGQTRGRFFCLVFRDKPDGRTVPMSELPQIYGILTIFLQLPYRLLNKRFVLFIGNAEPAVR